MNEKNSYLPAAAVSRQPCYQETDRLKRWMDNLAAMQVEVVELAPEMSWVGTRPTSLAQGGRLPDAAGK